MGLIRQQTWKFVDWTGDVTAFDYPEQFIPFKVYMWNIYMCTLSSSSCMWIVNARPQKNLVSCDKHCLAPEDQPEMKVWNKRNNKHCIRNSKIFIHQSNINFKIWGLKSKRWCMHAKTSVTWQPVSWWQSGRTVHTSLCVSIMREGFVRLAIKTYRQSWET